MPESGMKENEEEEEEDGRWQDLLALRAAALLGLERELGRQITEDGRRKTTRQLAKSPVKYTCDFDDVDNVTEEDVDDEDDWEEDVEPQARKRGDGCTKAM
eukprot:CAMPEP_0196573328 /NCGR_PEP_ID=MMETSP1081-20130531/3245_1 /TAXON_ID=36882 /ORGANISM="Pyramimonas amylifera, Strain CCMP720" /LENGTH=100 /DNA_ID=CAMNT_0041890991 /DNA_START=9 /DNA_END=311 /DNA_ORIENTATION=-